MHTDQSINLLNKKRKKDGSTWNRYDVWLKWKRWKSQITIHWIVFGHMFNMKSCKIIRGSSWNASLNITLCNFVLLIFLFFARDVMYATYSPMPDVEYSKSIDQAKILHYQVNLMMSTIVKVQAKNTAKLEILRSYGRIFRMIFKSLLNVIEMRNL